MHQKSQEELEALYNEKKKWFTGRIGKTVYRNKTSCACATCDNVYLNGINIADEYHAIYLLDISTEYSAEGFPLKYFDTIKERDEFELTLN